MIGGGYKFMRGSVIGVLREQGQEYGISREEQ